MLRCSCPPGIPAARHERTKSKSLYMSEPTHDVIIIGAGPAGASLAIQLGRAGFHVALIDKKAFPRHKACGEFMSPECLPMLENLGMRAQIAKLGAREVKGIRLSGYGKVSTGRYAQVGKVVAPFAHGYALRRELFDLAMVETAAAEAAVEFLATHRFKALIFTGEGKVIGARVLDPDGTERQLRAAFTIAADGMNSRVARSLGVRRELPWLRKFALVTRYQGTKDLETAEVHFFPGGYFACAPVDAGLLSMNLVLDQEELARPRESWDAFLAEYLALAPDLASRLRPATRVDPLRGIGPLACRTTQQTFHGAALLGDSCGYVDPVTGEGIYFALRGAELLSADLQRALHMKNYDRGMLRGYRRARRREFQPRMAFAKLLQRGMKRPLLTRAVLGLLEDRPKLADLLVAITGDYVPVGCLLKPSVWRHALARSSWAAT